MAYSRWGSRGSGNWYTFWATMSKDEGEENKDNAQFCICGTHTFSAKELRENLEECIKIIKEKDPNGDTEELKIYICEFLKDVDDKYERNY